MYFIKAILVLTAIVISPLFSLIDADIGCRDQLGNTVDWYYLYKLPKERDNHDVGDGLHYVYITSKTDDGNWKLSNVTIDNVNSIPGRTLTQLSKLDLVLMYNDEPPLSPTDGTNGHTKGVIATSIQGGFWLIHSVPKYPESIDANSYSFPLTAHHFGQSFLCISMNSSQIEIVGQQMLYNEPHIYYSNIPEVLKDKFQQLEKVSKMIRITEPPFWSKVTINSLEGFSLVSFAKTRKFKKELYQDWVAPTLKSNLLVETWLRGPGKISSDCTRQFHVLNVEDVKIEVANATFTSNNDHSKWGVGMENKDNWICVGDINRASHQKRRGGGTVCQNSTLIANAYRKLIQGYEPCQRN